MPVALDLNIESGETVTPDADYEFVDVAQILGAANEYGLFIEKDTNIKSGDNESNVCTTNLYYGTNWGFDGEGTSYIDDIFYGPEGMDVRNKKIILNKATIRCEIVGDSQKKWYVNDRYVGSKFESMENGFFDIPSAFAEIRKNAIDLFEKGTLIAITSDDQPISLTEGQNIYRIEGISRLVPAFTVNDTTTVIINITPNGEQDFYLKGQSTKGIDSKPNAGESNRIVYNFGDYNGTIVLSQGLGTVIAPNATVKKNGEGHWAGRVIAQNFESEAETHFRGGESTPTPPVTTPPVTTPPVTTPPVTTPPVTTPPVTTPPVTTPPVTTPPVTTPPVTTPPVTTPPVTTPPTTTTPDVPSVTPSATPETTPTATPNNTPTPESPNTPDDPGTPEDPGTPTDPGTPEDPATPETPQVLGARRRRMVTIEDEAVPLADRAVLGASRRPQTSDDSNAWNLGFALSLTSLGAWLVIKRRGH